MVFLQLWNFPCRMSCSREQFSLRMACWKYSFRFSRAPRLLCILCITMSFEILSVHNIVNILNLHYRIFIFIFDFSRHGWRRHATWFLPQLFTTTISSGTAPWLSAVAPRPQPATDGDWPAVHRTMVLEWTTRSCQNGDGQWFQWTTRCVWVFYLNYIGWKLFTSKYFRTSFFQSIQTIFTMATPFEIPNNNILVYKTLLWSISIA